MDIGERDVDAAKRGVVIPEPAERQAHDPGYQRPDTDSGDRGDQPGRSTPGRRSQPGCEGPGGLALTEKGNEGEVHAQCQDDKQQHVGVARDRARERQRTDRPRPCAHFITAFTSLVWIPHTNTPSGFPTRYRILSYLANGCDGWNWLRRPPALTRGGRR